MQALRRFTITHSEISTHGRGKCLERTFQPEHETPAHPKPGAVCVIARRTDHKLGRPTHTGANLLNPYRLNREQTTHAGRRPAVATIGRRIAKNGYEAPAGPA